MATPIQYESFSAAFVGMSTELDSLADNAKAVSVGQFDNSIGRDFHCLVELVVALGGAPAANGTVDVYFVPSLDGTNFDIGATGVLSPSDSLLVATFQPTQAGAARYIHRAELQTPGIYKIAVVNRTTKIFAASGNLINVRPFSDESG